MAPKKIRVCFFKPRIEPSQNGPFAKLLRYAGNLPNDQSRTVDINNHPIRLHRISGDGDVVVGEIVRHRIDDPAIKGRVTGEVEQMVMDDDEALLGMTAFLYHPRSNSLCLEQNRLGVGAGTFSKYFTRLAQIDGGIELHPVISEDGFQRLQKMQQVKSFEVKIATYDKIENFRREAPTVASAIELGKRLSAPYVEFRCSMGRKSGSLSTTDVVSAAKELMAKYALDDNEVTKLRIHGREPGEDEIEPLDLLLDRIVHEGSIELSHNPDELYNRRIGIIRDAWRQHKSTLLRYSPGE